MRADFAKEKKEPKKRKKNRFVALLYSDAREGTSKAKQSNFLKFNQLSKAKQLW